MKATELMIGDWIMWKPQKGGFIGIVGGDEAFKPELIKVRARHMDSMLNDYYPIPLTAEILEKNGFILSDDEDMWLFDDFQITVGFSQLIGGAKWITYQYVHTLQHALRLCGLNELADNFKV